MDSRRSASGVPFSAAPREALRSRRLAPQSSQTHQRLEGPARREERTWSDSPEGWRQVEVDYGGQSKQGAFGRDVMGEEGRWVQCRRNPGVPNNPELVPEPPCTYLSLTQQRDPLAARPEKRKSELLRKRETDDDGDKTIFATVPMGIRAHEHTVSSTSDDDDDVKITSAAAPVRTLTQEHKETVPSTDDDAAIARALQEEEEAMARRFSSRTTSTQKQNHHVASRQYETAPGFDEGEAARELQHGFRHSPYTPHYATRRRADLPVWQPHGHPPVHLRSIGRLHPLRTPDVYAGSMAIPDNSMSYESLLELEDVPVGMSRKAIASHSSTYTFNEASAGTSAPQTCSICLEPFAQDQKLRVLPCLHAFHRPCVDKWLSQSKQCPLCFKNIDELC